MILTPDGQALAGPALFPTTTTPGQAMDGLFYYTGRGLNWDMYGHNPGSVDPNATLTCTPDENGYNTSACQSINYFEWCQDHNKPLQAAPFGDVASGGPATLPDPNILVNGAWFGGSPYLGANATTRATFGKCSGVGNTTSCGTSGTTPPSGTIGNSPAGEAGFAFMWHSHNEREITTNNAFAGGMMMMMCWLTFFTLLFLAYTNYTPLTMRSSPGTFGPLALVSAFSSRLIPQCITSALLA